MLANAGLLDQVGVRRHVFSTLDAMRGVAAVAVAFRHVPKSWFSMVSRESFLAVDLFFVLSGFVLAHAYEHRLRDGLSPTRFMVTRVIRLYPMYMVATLLSLAIYLAPETTGWTHPSGLSVSTIIFGFLFLPQVSLTNPGLPFYPLVGTAWSLFLELAVNLVFAAIVVRLDNRLLAGIVAVAAVLLTIVGIHYGTLDVGHQQLMVGAGFVRVGFGFFAGVAAYRLWIADALPRLRLPTWAVIVGIAALFHIHPATGEGLYDVAAVFAMPLLVLAGARSKPSRWLSLPSAKLGAASYSIYVIQVPVVLWFSYIMPTAWLSTYGGLKSAGAVALVCALIFAASVLDHWCDVPMRAALTRAWRKIDRTSVQQWSRV